MKQSKIDSFKEATFNVAIGYIISVLVTLAILPLWGFEPTPRDAGEISLVYSIISIGRTYVVRRVFNIRKIK